MDDDLIPPPTLSFFAKPKCRWCEKTFNFYALNAKTRLCTKCSAVREKLRYALLQKTQLSPDPIKLVLSYAL